MTIAALEHTLRKKLVLVGKDKPPSSSVQ